MQGLSAGQGLILGVPRLELEPMMRESHLPGRTDDDLLGNSSTKLVRCLELQSVQVFPVGHGAKNPSNALDRL